MQRSREKRRREERGRGKRKDEERGEREERKGCACVCVGATCLAAGRQRRGLWEDARRWLETSGEGILPFYSPLGFRMADVLCAGGK